MKIAEALTASNEKLKMDPEKSEVSFNQGTTPSLQWSFKLKSLELNPDFEPAKKARREVEKIISNLCWIVPKNLY